MSKLWRDVLQAVLVALILAVLAKVWTTYEMVMEMRHDLDQLYSLVDDVAKQVD